MLKYTESSGLDGGIGPALSTVMSKLVYLMFFSGEFHGMYASALTSEEIGELVDRHNGALGYTLYNSQDIRFRSVTMSKREAENLLQGDISDKMWSKSAGRIFED